MIYKIGDNVIFVDDEKYPTDFGNTEGIITSVVDHEVEGRTYGITHVSTGIICICREGAFK